MKDRLQIAKKNRRKVGIILLLLGIIILIGQVTQLLPDSQLTNPFIAMVLLVFGILLILKVNVTFP
jgi:hypothetical protein